MGEVEVEEVGNDRRARKRRGRRRRRMISHYLRLKEEANDQRSPIGVELLMKPESDASSFLSFLFWGPPSPTTTTLLKK